MSYTPGDSFNRRFPTHEPDTGARKDATSLPTGTLVRNGSDTGETVTVTNIAVGDYRAAGTVPAGWDAGDEVEVKIEATVEDSEETAVTANVFLDLGVLDKRVDTLHDLQASDVVSDGNPLGTTNGVLGEVAALTGHTPQTGDVFSRIDVLTEDVDGWRFTSKALEQAEGGEDADWTTSERQQIRHRLGLDGDASEPSASPSLSTLVVGDILASPGNKLATDASGHVALAEVDGIEEVDHRAIMLGFAVNRNDVSDSNGLRTVEFRRADGSTAVATVTFDPEDGQRTVSNLHL